MSERSAGERVQRRARRRRLLFWTFIVAAIVAAILLIRCGGGFGLGKGKGGLGGGSARGLHAGSGSASGSAPAPARCALRVDATGVSVDGKATTIADAVAACRSAGGADVVVAGDARQGTWDELRAALDAAGVPSLVKSAGSAAPVDAAGP